LTAISAKFSDEMVNIADYLQKAAENSREAAPLAAGSGY
jgi:hypothetical protein